MVLGWPHVMQVKPLASYLNKKGEHLANVPITYAAEPASIVATGLRGGLTCLKRGEKVS